MPFQARLRSPPTALPGTAAWANASAATATAVARDAARRLPAYAATWLELRDTDADANRPPFLAFAAEAPTPSPVRETLFVVLPLDADGDDSAALALLRNAVAWARVVAAALPSAAAAGHAAATAVVAVCDAECEGRLSEPCVVYEEISASLILSRP